MSEPIFFARGRTLTLEEVVKLTGAELSSAPARRISNIAAIDVAGPSDLTFFDKGLFSAQAGKTHAAACLTTKALAAHLPEHTVALIAREPYRGFVAVARELFPQALRPSSLFDGADGKSAHVHPQARLESGVIVDPGAVIGSRAEIGSSSIIGSNAVIGPEVRIGRECSIGPGAVVSNALIGDRVIVHAGCKIGQDGFGYIMGARGHQKIPQIGRVIIQDDVEIGAGTAIDRGAIRDTVIGEGTKIDNQVQIGHNVQVGRYCILVAQTGISGSVTIGDYAMLGGQVGIGDHISIGEGAMIGAKSGVIHDIPAGTRWGGYPAVPRMEWLRGQMALRRLVRGSTAAKLEGRPDGDGES